MNLERKQTIIDDKKEANKEKKRENNAYGFLCELVCQDLSEFQYGDNDFYLKKLMIDGSQGRNLDFKGLITFLQDYSNLDEIRDLIVYLNDEKINEKKVYHLPDFIVKRVCNNRIEEVTFLESKKFGDIDNKEKRAIKKLAEKGYVVHLIIMDVKPSLKKEDVDYLLKLESEFNRDKLPFHNFSFLQSKVLETKEFDKNILVSIVQVELDDLTKWT